MININSNGQVIVSYKDKIYSLKDQDDYKKFVILITDPVEEFDSDFLSIDKEVSEKDQRLQLICVKYKEFFEEFLKSKEVIVNEAKKEVLSKSTEVLSE